MSILAQNAEPVADPRLKLVCMLCGRPVPPHRRGWAATCLACEPEPTAADWADYAAWAAEVERALADAYLADLAEAEAWLDEPDPASEVELAADDREWERRFAAVRDAFESGGLTSEGH